jgi:hypothetical protein
MTTRHAGYIVVLRDDLREDDAQKVITALGMIQGVLSVQPVEANGHDLIAQARADENWRAALVTLVQYGPDAAVNPGTRRG